MIRPASLDDIEAITSIYRQAVLEETGTFELMPPDAAEMAARYQKIVDGGFPYLVAATSSGVLGYAYVGAYHHRPAYRFAVEDSIYVGAAARGQGVGAALLQELIAQSTKRGFRQMVAVVGDSANEGSIKLHARAGFLPAGAVRSCGWKNESWLDVVFMQLALGEGATTPPAG